MLVLPEPVAPTTATVVSGSTLKLTAESVSASAPG